MPKRKKQTKERPLKVAIVTSDKELHAALGTSPMSDVTDSIDAEMTSLTTIAKVLSRCKAPERARILWWLNAYWPSDGSHDA